MPTKLQRALSWLTSTGRTSAAQARTDMGVDTAISTAVAAEAAARNAAITAAVTGLLELKGVIDCSGNPNYPAAEKGDGYKVSVAGKIGGASGVNVQIGDMVIALADTIGGTQAGVGANWFITQANLVPGTDFLVPASNLSEVASPATAFANIKQPATDTTTGVVELATPTEVITGNDSARAVTPLGDKAALDAKVDPVANSRGPRQGIRIRSAGTYADMGAGVTGDITLHAVFRVPTDAASISANGYASVCGVSQTSDSTDGSGGLRILFNVNLGSFGLGTQVAGGGRLAMMDITPWAGRVVEVVAGRNGSIPFLYIDGQSQVLTETTYGGAPPIDFSEVDLSGSRYFNLGFRGASDYLLSDLFGATCYNYALTAAQVARLFATGAVDPADIWSGGNRRINTVTWGVTSDSGTVTITNNTSDGFDYSGNGTGAWSAISTASVSTKKGAKIRVRGTVEDMVGGGVVSCTLWPDVPVEWEVASANGDFDILIECPRTGDDIRFQFGVPVGSGQSGKLRNLVIETAGALVALDPQWEGLGSYWPDVSGNGNHATLGAGVESLMRRVPGAVASGFQSTLFGPPPIISIQMPAGASYTNGQVVAEVVGASQQNTSGIFLLTNSANGVRLVALANTPYYGDFSGTAVDVVAVATTGGYGLPFTLQFVTTAGVPKLQLVATQDVTMEVTNTVWVQHLGGSLPANLVK